MTNIFVRFFITLFLSFLLITSSSLAFHKKNSLSDNKNTDWDGSKETKKNSENLAKQDFCALDANAIKIIEVGGGEKVINEITGKQTIDEEGNPVFDDKEVYKITVKGYHTPEPRNTGGILIPTPANGLNFNISQDWRDIKLLTVLKMYCLQLKTEERPYKFKGSYLEDFYSQIAAENGYLKSDGVTGDYNKKLMEGPEGRGPVEGRDILKDGIIISNPNAVWYLPDFLIDQDLEIKEKAELKAKQQAEADRIAKEKAAKAKKKKARKDTNEKWISENKQKELTKYKEKKKDFDDQITALNTARDKLAEQFKEFEEFLNIQEKESQIAIEDLDKRGNEEIKNLRSELRNAMTNFLSKSDLKEYKDKLEQIKKYKFDNYENYKNLKSLIKRAEKSKSIEDFVGKDGVSLNLFGYEFTFKSKKMGIIKEFENIKNKEIGSDYKIHEEEIKKLRLDIIKHEDDINNYVVTARNDLINKDAELSDQTPWNLIIIGVVIVLIIIGVGVYLYFQRKEMDQLKREAEEKVGSLKNEFEGKLKSTSEQIKSAARNTQRSQQTSLETQEVIEEKPKTPEEIIAEKYDELVSDYKESLDDFTKVAGFKQKWHGLALSRKERQEGTKTILVNSSRAFEKAEIWCVTFSDKYFAFPGSTVKSNMATYMNLDFEKASRDFKGVYSVSTGSNYMTEPCVLRRGGAGFVVERVGKIVFPN